MNCILGHRLLSFACTRRRHSRHAKPYPKVILERRKHLFGSIGECELHSGPPIALLPTAHASCLRPQAPQSARQTIPKSNSGVSKTLFWMTRGAFWATEVLLALLPTAHASCLHPQAPQSACQTIQKSNFGASKTPFQITRRV